MDNEFDYSDLYLDYGKIANSSSTLAVTRLLASHLMTDSYITVGEFLTKMTDGDLQSLVELADREDNPHIGDYILIAEMLATGEGCDQAKDFEEFQSRTDQLVSLLLVESLHRKGLVLAHHENFSFHEDMKNKIVVERREGLDYDQFK